MKTSNKIFSLKFLIICFTIALFIAGCKRDKKTISVAQQEQLPEATEEGKNTFGCKINNEVFIPKNYSSEIILFGYKPLKVSLNINNGVQISANRINKDGTYSFIHLYARDTLKLGSLKLKLYKDAFYGPMFYTSYEFRYIPNNNGNYYFINDTINSKLEILKLDTIKKIISGKFNFSFNLNNDNINVTDGVFDLKY